MGSFPRDRGPGGQLLGFTSSKELSPVGSCPTTVDAKWLLKPLAFWLKLPSSYMYHLGTSIQHLE